MFVVMTVSVIAVMIASVISTLGRACESAWLCIY